MRAVSGAIRCGLVSLAVLMLTAETLRSESTPNAGNADELFLDLFLGDINASQSALARIGDSWEEGYVPMALESVYLLSNPGTAVNLIRLLEDKTGEQFGSDLNEWYRWLWSRPEVMHPRYADFKAALYSYIDPRFGGYFRGDLNARIRLDEVRWGGVVQDGIPPLRNPAMIEAENATWLDDDHVVFGLEIEGDARAYPKRIMGWHEMFLDTVGGVSVAGVYCTLCGAMILYRTETDGVTHELGTSGFLYRSNKLMYDQATQSLWNTLWGQPVLGPLAKSEIELERGWLVTTTWGEWRRRHPDTKVLSLDTGYQRDYSEGAAYREYFATDALMFQVPVLDNRLLNKDEVLGLILPAHPDEPVAVSVRFLDGHRIYHHQIGELRFVVVTDASGANRVYEAGTNEFTGWDGDRRLTDANGKTWILTEDSLASSDGSLLQRLPAHRSFWFGWYSAYPGTRLIR